MGQRSGPGASVARRNTMRLGNVLAIAGVLGAAVWIGRWAVEFQSDLKPGSSA